MQTAQDTPQRSRRRLEDLKNLPRSASASHLYRAAEQAAPPNYPRLSLFAPSAIWQWIKSYLPYAFRRKFPFPTHAASACSAMYDARPFETSGELRVSLAGDWGSGTDEAEDVAIQMQRFQPHVTIHLGDIYYVGDPPEVNENCLGVINPLNNYTPVKWPHGSRASFALNGNHEMYANGDGYFAVLLPTLGVRDATGRSGGQQTSFFCIENDHWRIIAIDTGYNSTGLPILGAIPLFSHILWIAGDCHLADEQVEWIRQIVRPEQDRRGIILLSHHQYYSAFDIRYPKPAQQLWRAGIKRDVLWFWGHEHRLAGYGLESPNSLRAFGRCLGHGGMPLDLNGPTHEPRPEFYDARAGQGFGVQGHANLTFNGPQLSVAYVDRLGATLLREEWHTNETGNVERLSSEPLITDPAFHNRRP